MLMEDKSGNSKTEFNYWLVLGIGVAYIILLGLFTYFLNYPI